MWRSREEGCRQGVPGPGLLMLGRVRGGGKTADTVCRITVKAMAVEYRTALPDEALLVAEIKRARDELDPRNDHLPALREGA